MKVVRKWAEWNELNQPLTSTGNCFSVHRKIVCLVNCHPRVLHHRGGCVFYFYSFEISHVRWLNQNSPHVGFSADKDVICCVTTAFNIVNISCVPLSYMSRILFLENKSSVLVGQYKHIKYHIQYLLPIFWKAFDCWRRPTPDLEAQ